MALLTSDAFPRAEKTTMREPPKLDLYTYYVNGIETTAQLSETDARRLGATLSAAPAPAGPPEAPVGKARKTAANK